LSDSTTPREPSTSVPVFYDAEALELAELVCTEKQMEVLRLRNLGMGVRPIARKLLITPSSAKSRLDAADLRMQRATGGGVQG
jgi:hypothetical protein